MKRNMQILGFCMLFVILLLSGCSLMPANNRGPHRDEPGLERQGYVLFDIDGTGHRTGQGYGQ